MRTNITRSDEIDFLTYLEYAAVSRTVVELQLKHQPEQWTKEFINRIQYTGEKEVIHTFSGKAICRDEILAVSTPFENYDEDVIQCNC